MLVTTRATEEVTINYQETGELIVTTMMDEAPGKGRLIISGSGQSNSCFWNNMGTYKVREFFLANNDRYVINSLDPFGTLFYKIDPANLIPAVVKDIEENTSFSDEQKLLLTGRTREFTPISDVNSLHALNSELMMAIYGPMWINQVNEQFLGKHPLYVNLLARIATVRSVLDA